jgi:hypothetical protein
MAVDMTTQSIAVGDNWVKVGNDYVGDNPSGTAPSYQLPTANYVDTGMPMNLVFPRPEAASWSYAKNAYPNVKWNIPIGIQGGAWPFNYEITDNGGATGLAIGSFLLGVIDGPTGKTTYSVPDDYGVLSWDNPVAGSYAITVRVTDQAGATLDVAVSLTVGTSGWLFVDPVGGNDSTGDGTIGSPFASLVPLHNDSNLTSTYSNHRVYLRDGVTPLGGMSTSNNNYRVEPIGAPKQFIGYPNETVKLENTTGWIWLNGVDDFLLMDMEYAYADAFSPVQSGGIWQIVETGGGSRATINNVELSRFTGTPQNIGLANPACFLSDDSISENLYMGRVSVTGAVGQVLCSFKNQNSLCEHWTIRSATLSMPNIEPFAFLFIKDDPDYFTVRNIDADSTVTSSAASSVVGFLAQDGGTNLEFSYIKAYRPVDGAREGAIKLFNNSSQTITASNIYTYRNSVEEIKWEGDSNAGVLDDAMLLTKNVSNQTLPTSTRIDSIDNIEAGTFFDSSMNLTGAARTAYLGTHGAEVAQ